MKSTSGAATYLKNALAQGRQDSSTNNSLPVSQSQQSLKASLQISHRPTSSASKNELKSEAVLTNWKQKLDENFSDDDSTPEKLIDQKLVFKCAMNSNHAKIIELIIGKEDITHIDSQNDQLKLLGPSLRRFDLSSNLIRTIENLDSLSNLRELNLSYNLIKNIENLSKFPHLQSLTLDHNKISQIKNLRYLRKLEKLSLVGNLLTQVTQDTTEGMLELKELYLQRNQIKCIEVMHNYPNLEELYLNGNPLQMVFPEAFMQMKKLTTLDMSSCKFKYPEQDLVFLRLVQSSLTRLYLNNAFPKENLQSIDIFSFLNMEELDDLQLRKVGLIHLKKIDEIFPNIAVLDVADNKIFSVEYVEILHKLPMMAEVSFKNNPICVHKHLKDMITDVVPQIEVINQETFQEAGHKYKEDIKKIRDQIEKLGRKPGSYKMEQEQEIQDDPDFKIYDPSKEEDEDEDLESKSKKIDLMYRQANKDDSKKEALFNDIEKNFGLRLKPLNEYADANDEAISDPLKDMDIFKEVVKDTYGQLRSQKMDTIDDVRTREYETFQRISESRGGSRNQEMAYKKIDMEVEKIKDKIKQAQNAKNLISGDFLDYEVQKRGMTFRDFYHANESDGGSSDDDSSNDGVEERGPWVHGKTKKQKKQNKRGMYQNQVNKILNSDRDMNASFMSGPGTPGLPPSQRGNSATRRSRDFVIKKGNSMTSSQTDFNQSKHQNEKYLKEQRKQIGGLGTKPHNLKDQNEVIKRMLDRETLNSGNNLLSQAELKSTISGTPQPPKRVVSKRGNSQSRVIEKEMVLPPKQIGNTILQQQKTQMGRPPSSGGFQTNYDSKKSTLTSAHKRAGSLAVKVQHSSAQRVKDKSPDSNYSSDELDFNDAVDDDKSSESKSKIDPEKRAMLYKPLKTIKEKQGLKKAKEILFDKNPEYKQNFLYDFLEHSEQKIEFFEQQDKLRQKTLQQKASRPKQHVEKMAPQQQMLPKNFKSKAFRVKIDGEEEEQKRLTQAVRAYHEVPKILKEVTPEEEIILTTEEITQGVEQAKQAVNAVPLDVVAFEQKLKAKHDELKAAGIVPQLNMPPPINKYKVGIKKVNKN